MYEKVKHKILKVGFLLIFAAMLFSLGKNTARAADLTEPGTYSVPIVSFTCNTPYDEINAELNHVFGDSILLVVDSGGWENTFLDIQHMIVDMGTELGVYHCNILSIEGGIIVDTEPRKITANLGQPHKVSEIEAPIKVKMDSRFDEHNQKNFSITIDVVDYWLGGGMPYPMDGTLTVDFDKATHALADYSKIDALLETVPDDLTKYTDDSVAALTEVIEATQSRDKLYEQQTEVDQLAEELEKAIRNLELKPESETPAPDTPEPDDPNPDNPNPDDPNPDNPNPDCPCPGRPNYKDCIQKIIIRNEQIQKRIIRGIQIQRTIIQRIQDRICWF